MPTADEIKEAREKAGLTQAAAAALIPVDRVTWARWEGSQRTMPAYAWKYWLHVAGLVRIPFRRR